MASGTRGYSSYHGRGRKGKVFLAVLLILVILASVGFIIARENMTYDAAGNLRFTLPWAEPTPEEDTLREEPAGDVTIEEPRRPETIRAFVVKEQPLTQTVWEEALDPSNHGAPDCGAVAVTVKGTGGTVYFDSTAAVAGSVSLGEDTAEALALMNGSASGYDTIARVSCFHDPKAANHDVEGMGLKNTGGFIFYDGSNSQWLDPGKEDARAYLTAIIREAAELGFDEILLTDVSYPTEGKLDKIAYTGQDSAATASEGRQANLALFLKEVRAALPEGVALSMELDADTIRTGGNDAAGQALDQIVPLVDRVYARTTEAEAPVLAAAVETAGCDFVPELSEVPAETLESWLLLRM